MRFGQRAQETLLRTYQTAESFYHRHIGTEHLLIAFIQDVGPIGNLLSVSNVDLAVIVDAARAIYWGAEYPSVPYSRAFSVIALDLQIVLSAAAYEANAQRKTFIGADRLFLTMLSHRDCHACQILQQQNIRPGQLRQEYMIAQGGGPPAVRNAGLAIPFSWKFSDPVPTSPSNHARIALEVAKETAIHYHHASLNTAHLLIGLIEVEGQAQRILTRLGLDSVVIREAVERWFAENPPNVGPKLGLSTELEQVLLLAESEGLPGESAIGTGHLLLAITLQPHNAALEILKTFNISDSRIQGLVVRWKLAE